MVPNKSKPDPIIVRRFEDLCGFLASNRNALPTAGFHDLAPLSNAGEGRPLPHTSPFSTAFRNFEQTLRSLH